MRLIDADNLKKVSPCVTLADREWYKRIDDQPTAYDVDKVVDQLDGASDIYEGDEQGQENMRLLNLTEAIEAVREGGRDE